MSALDSSAPGSSTPGGELQQISPGAWPTESGGQTESPTPPPAPAQTKAASIPALAAQLKGNWEPIKRDLQKKYSELTDSDLRYIPGQEQPLLDRLRQKTGSSRAEIEEALKLKSDRRR